MSDRTFSESRIPLAYLITFRCYGTWLHGDERGSVDRDHNVYGTPFLSRDTTRQHEEQLRLKHAPVELDSPKRETVETAIRDVCAHRGWTLRAINVRTNHIHSVVTAACKPEKILNDFKAYATRGMREAGLWKRPTTPWAEKGSRRYLWSENSVARAIDYVLTHQGNDIPPDFDDDDEPL